MVVGATGIVVLVKRVSYAIITKTWVVEVFSNYFVMLSKIQKISHVNPSRTYVFLLMLDLKRKIRVLETCDFAN